MFRVNLSVAEEQLGMRLVVISDTHGGHRELGTLEGDVLIHCGDVEHLFVPDPAALESVDAWFGQQRFDHILVTGGNHDLALQQRVLAGESQPFRNATYLQDSGVEIDGVSFYGSPWVPELQGHAFFADDGMLRRAWDSIPDQVDVLITHTPPFGILDVSSRDLVLGCAYLLERLAGIRPKLHCFGHVHAASGVAERDGTTFVNAALVDRTFQIARPPFVCDLGPDGVRTVA